MARFWPEGTKFSKRSLEFQECKCDSCGSLLYKSKNRPRKIYTMEGPLLLERERAKCSNEGCDKSKKWFLTMEEQFLTMPRWKIGWDVFTWIGFRRFKRHWSVPQIKEELSDSHSIELSENSIEDYLQRYQVMTAERHQDLDLLEVIYDDVKEVDLTIDGLQPEKGHETLYVVRDLTKQRVWFAVPLVSSSNEEVRQLFKGGIHLYRENFRSLLKVANCNPGGTKHCSRVVLEGLFIYSPGCTTGGRSPGNMPKKRPSPCGAFYIQKVIFFWVVSGLLVRFMKIPRVNRKPRRG